MSCKKDDSIIKITQGHTFAYVVSLDTTLSPDFFEDWDVKGQIRRFKDKTPSGFVCNLEIARIDDPEKNTFLLYYPDTSEWSVGLVELNLVLTNNAGNYQIPTEIRIFDIQRAVTR